jgi:hypothetical protein
MPPSKPPVELPDPRTWLPASPDVPWAEMQAALEAPTREEADARDANVHRWLRERFDAGDTPTMAQALAHAPSPALARHFIRLLADVERTYLPGDALRATLFAMPVVIVTALEPGRAGVTLSCVLPDVEAIAAPLRAARTFGGCETFALSRSLAAANSIDIDALPVLLARTRMAEPPADDRDALARFDSPLDLPPAPIRVDATDERVHLRFIVGAALAPPGVDPLAEPTFGREGMALARAIGEALKAPGLSLLALPRPPQRLSLAVPSGRAAQREVSAQLFASNAIRKLRTSYGEPTAIVSAHRAPDAPGRGELRLSLSSPFAAKAAEGFRCPIYATESVQEVAGMLATLLGDCQVGDVRTLGGIHDDVDPVTGQALFFKDHGAASPLH